MLLSYVLAFDLLRESILLVVYLLYVCLHESELKYTGSLTWRCVDFTNTARRRTRLHSLIDGMCVPGTCCVC